MGKSTPQTQTQSVQTSSGPWAPAQGQLKDILGRANTLGNMTDLFAPGATTQAGISQVVDAAGQPSQAVAGFQPVAQGAQDSFGEALEYLRSRASGGQLHGNPYFDDVLSDVQQRTADSVNAQFSGAGRFGSGSHAGVLTDRLGDLANRIMFDNYNRERGFQVDAQDRLFGFGSQAGQIGAAADTAATGAGERLMGAGQLEDAAYQAPLRALEWQTGLTVPIASLGKEGTSTGTTTAMPAKPSPWQTGLGAALTLGSLAMQPGSSMAGFMSPNFLRM